ncbi:MAG: hypothetical protein E7010_01675 [Alphaproteobacteria bacterium]|nr:hypothetical protein [Alphaproteobacteria bacterium]
MLQNWLILAPEFSLLAYLPTAFLINHFREEKTAKTFFTVSKFFLLFSLLMTIVFYNQSPFLPWLQNSPYSTLFKTLVYLVSLAWFYLSSKWFLNKNRSSYKFYSLAVWILFLISFLISARHLFVLSVIFPLSCLAVRSLILLHWDEEKVSKLANLYSCCATLFCLLLWCGTGFLYYSCGSVDYAIIQEVLSSANRVGIYTLLGVCFVLSSILFMMAVAPFHSWFVGVLSSATLPVCGFLTLTLPIAWFFGLITLSAKSFLGLAPLLHNILLCFAIVSLFIGAFSANGQKNIRSLFSFVSIYNTGFLLFGFISFNNDSIMGVFSYELIYVLAMLGVYTVFLGLKSKSEYLSDIDKISGLSNIKPYISAAFLVFMFSLIGMPPMLGFLGRLAVANTLVLEEQWIELGILLTSILFMANAFLNVVRTIYFEPLKNSFDRTDKAIYISLFINLILVIISILNPSYVLLGAETILKGVF